MLVALIVGIVIGVIANAVVIWIVSRLGLGLSVRNFGAAIKAALIIAIVGWVVTAVLAALGISAGSGLVGAIVHLVIAAIVLMLSDRILPDLQVGGFGGALIAAIALGAVAWLIGLVLGALGMALM